MRYGTTTTMPGPEVIRHAIEVFGPEGHGLTLTERNLLKARLEHQVGHVAIEADLDADGRTELTIETIEFDREVRAFIEQLPRSGSFLDTIGDFFKSLRSR